MLTTSITSIMGAVPMSIDFTNDLLSKPRCLDNFLINLQNVVPNLLEKVQDFFAFIREHSFLHSIIEEIDKFINPKVVVCTNVYTGKHATQGFKECLGQMVSNGLSDTVVKCLIIAIVIVVIWGLTHGVSLATMLGGQRNSYASYGSFGPSNESYIRQRTIDNFTYITEPEEITHILRVNNFNKEEINDFLRMSPRIRKQRIADAAVTRGYSIGRNI